MSSFKGDVSAAAEAAAAAAAAAEALPPIMSSLAILNNDESPLPTSFTAPSNEPIPTAAAASVVEPATCTTTAAAATAAHDGGLLPPGAAAEELQPAINTVPRELVHYGLLPVLSSGNMKIREYAVVLGRVDDLQQQLDLLMAPCNRRAAHLGPVVFETLKELAEAQEAARLEAVNLGLTRHAAMIEAAAAGAMA